MNLSGVLRLSTRNLAIASALVTGALLAPPAQAASKIGDSYPLTSPCATSNPAPVDIQKSSAANSYAAPFDGVITSWRNDGAWPTLTFKVARLGTGSNYTVIGSDGPRSMASSSPESFGVRIPVRQGDVIGARRGSGTFECTMPGTSADSVGRENPPEVPVGGAGFFDTTLSNATVPVEAYIERDSDNDGYGDETQDACPTNASTQGACPLPTTLGQTFIPEETTCGPEMWVVTSSPGVVHAAPADGVITSWSHQAASTVGGGTVEFEVLRPQGGNAYLSVADDGPRTLTAGALNSWKVRIPVRRGDKLGLTALGVACRSSNTNWSLGSFPSDLSPGTAATTAGSSSRMLDVSAVLEADADNDGFGDTTQDLCPTDATTQGACRTAQPQPQPPAGDDACDRARKKLAKAKSKLKKLKQGEAKAKQLKSAKAKVKKAKKAVRKAC